MVLDVGAVPGGSAGMPGSPVRKQTGQGGVKSQRAAELVALGDKMFMEKAPLNALCQEIAENVYPERADFTTVRYLGENFSDHLMDSFPQLARRELGNSMSAILRPRGKPWFAASTRDDELDNDPAVARFLEYVTAVTRNKMYDRRTDFISASKIADHDYVTFGQAVMSVEEGPTRTHIFYRPFHFRDVVWLENEINKIDHVHRKERMSARQMARFFSRRVLAPEVTQALEKAPGMLFNIRCIVMPADEYDTISGKATWGTETSGGRRGDGDPGQAGGFATPQGFRAKCPFVAIYVDADHQVVLKEQKLRLFPYLIPRWHRISGFQYAFSPASMTSLPDARMMQMMTRIIVESGEKAIDPPILALEDRVREANLGSGMITWVDAAYDGKLDDALKPLHLEPDIKLGLEMRKDLRDMFSRAWFLDKLALPPEAGSRTTAYEIAQRIEEHVRNLLPLFEPTEVEYSDQALDKTFYVLDQMKCYDWSLMPDALSGKDIFWTFKNPMQEASERTLVSQFGEVMQLVKAAQEFGLQTAPVKIDVALKDAIRGTAAPAAWRKTKQEEAQDAEEAAKKQQMDSMMQAMAAGGQIAQGVGKGAQELQQAGLLKHPGQDQGQPQQQGPAQGPPIPLPQPQLAPRQQAPALPTFNPAEVGPPGQAGQ